ncbi:hypothetical protein Tco_1077790, partial [Tanacetum coccineum]
MSVTFPTPIVLHHASCDEENQTLIPEVLACRKAYFLEDKQIPSVGMYDEVSFHTNLEALEANGDVLEAFRGISRLMDEVRMEPG